MSTVVYTAERKSQAKALALVLGSPEKAHRTVAELWDEVPTARSIRNWVADPDVAPDMQFVTRFTKSVDAQAIGYAQRIMGPLVGRIEFAIGRKSADGKSWEGGKSLDLHNDIRSFVFTANLIRPSNATGNGGTNQFTQINDYRGAQIATYGPAEPPPERSVALEPAG